MQLIISSVSFLWHSWMGSPPPPVKMPRWFPSPDWGNSVVLRPLVHIRLTLRAFLQLDDMLPQACPWTMTRPPLCSAGAERALLCALIDSFVVSLEISSYHDLLPHHSQSASNDLRFLCSSLLYSYIECLYHSHHDGYLPASPHTKYDKTID